MVAHNLTMKHIKQLTQCKDNLTKTLLFICPILILFLRVYAFYFDLYFDIFLQNVHLGFMAMIVKKVAAITVLYLGHVTG